ncbi:TniQ family protein [Microbacterium lacticum]|uniref:TniQ family protein n=1 Tax=Microbacterium lacticum TaxID=33885 RepID=UPI003A85F170
MTRRWPLHPTPGHGEALTSWLHRLATRYGMDLDQLVRHDLTPPGAPAPGSTGSLDLDAPSELITILAARTGGSSPVVWCHSGCSLWWVEGQAVR